MRAIFIFAVVLAVALGVVARFRDLPGEVLWHGAAVFVVGAMFGVVACGLVFWLVWTCDGREGK